MISVHGRLLHEWRKLGLDAEARCDWRTAAAAWRNAVLCFEETDALPGTDAFADQGRLMDREEACMRKAGRRRMARA